MFEICCKIMSVLGNFIGLSYGEINVLVFLYIEPIIFLLLGLLLIRRNTLLGASELVFWGIVFSLMKVHYPISDLGFNLIYTDLYALADYCNVSYVTINYVLFILLPIYMTFTHITILLNKKSYEETPNNLGSHTHECDANVRCYDNQHSREHNCDADNHI